MSGLAIAGRPVGPGAPCFVICEAGVNHDGDADAAHALVDAAAEAGADAIKFQTFEPEALADPGAKKAAYQVETTGAGESQLDMLRKLALPREAWAGLKSHAEARGLVFLSTPFDPQSAHVLVDLGMAAIKVPSGELTNLPFLSFLARFGLPMIVSTGMGDLGEVHAAVAALETENASFCLLHCTSSYPAAPEDANLRAMETMRHAFGRVTGYSDHTLGTAVALASVAMGAAVLEKHMTLDRNRPGPDHRASLEPGEFAGLMRDLRAVEAALGSGRKEPFAGEREVAVVARKSLVAARDLAAGQIIAAADLTARRPGDGLSPALAHLFLGRTLRRSVVAGERLDAGMIA
jgi:N-acetylneuraminate synthase/N,N'-diacetyllegionaminate synthase